MKKSVKGVITNELKLFHQVIDFGIISIIGTGIQLLLLFILSSYLNFYYLASVIIAFILTTIYSFLASKHFTFHSKVGFKVCEERFFIVSLFSLLANIILIYVLTGIFKMFIIKSQIIVSLVLFTSTFFIHKYWTFYK
jgi:putative flippase GtrA